jgi:hypothetical protein
MNPRVPARFLVLAAACLAWGCGSSTTAPGNNMQTQIKSSQAVVTGTLSATTDNDAQTLLSQPGWSGLFGAPEIRAVLRGAAGEPVRVGQFHPQGVRGDYEFPTGSYRISGGVATKYSDVPMDGLFVIARSVLAAADSDSVRMSGVTYHHSVVNTLPQTYQLNVFVAHPRAAVTDHHVASYGFRAHYTALGIPDSLYLSQDYPTLGALSEALGANFFTGVYGAHFAATNHKTSESFRMDYSVHGSGRALLRNYAPDSSDLVIDLNHAGSDWLTSLHYSDIHGDTATVSGDIKKDGTQVATIAGTTYPVADGQCPPVVITLVDTGLHFSFCDLFGGQPPSADFAGVRGSGSGGGGGKKLGAWMRVSAR